MDHEIDEVAGNTDLILVALIVVEVIIIVVTDEIDGVDNNCRLGELTTLIM
jgi:hypothetical protein